MNLVRSTAAHPFSIRAALQRAGNGCFPWLAVCGVLGGGAAGLAYAASMAGRVQAFEALGWNAQSWVWQPWTLWTAAWVNVSVGSLAGNVLALAALAVVGAAVGADGLAALALAAAWPLSTLFLLWWPQVTSYGGLSGAVHAAAAVLGMHVALRTAFKPLGFVLFAAVAVKLLAERSWLQPVAFDPNWGSNVVYAANLAGTLAGAACTGLLKWWLSPGDGQAA